ncbi:hypothetical protein CHARACLAT_004539 [Characodon lateralis]|uniref:Uncharacterized protein n=1 Tax=Characodon lateralis TaxID=208331 RepID=A0ABU7CLB1_9TELE|nr:hypothetical protein [Characodon lateralis]
MIRLLSSFPATIKITHTHISEHTHTLNPQVAPIVFVRSSCSQSYRLQNLLQTTSRETWGGGRNHPQKNTHVKHTRLALHSPLCIPFISTQKDMSARVLSLIKGFFFPFKFEPV